MTLRKKLGLGWRPFALARGRRKSPLGRFRIPLRRYLVASFGISSAALGLALIATFLSVLYAQGGLRFAPLAEASSVAVEASTSSVFYARVTQNAVEAAQAPIIRDSSSSIPPASAFVGPLAESLRRDQVVVKGRIHNVNITFYDCLEGGFCGRMSNGRHVYEGAAACSWNLPAGTKFLIVGDPTNRVYTCEDRGLLTNTWVDIFWRDPDDGWVWQSIVGRYGTIEIVELP